MRFARPARHLAAFFVVSIVGCGDCADRKQLAEGGMPDAATDGAPVDAGIDDAAEDVVGAEPPDVVDVPDAEVIVPPFASDVVAWFDSKDPALVVDVSNVVTSWPARYGAVPALEPYGQGGTATMSTVLDGRTVTMNDGVFRTTTAVWNTVQNSIIVLVVPATVTGEDVVGTGDFWRPNDTLLMIYNGAIAGHFWPINSASGTQTYGTIPVTVGVPHVLSQVNDGIAKTLAVYTDGVENGAATWPQDASPTPLRPIFVGRRCETCLAPETFTGEIAEVLIYDRPLSTTERVEAEDFLRGLWSLPSP